MMTFSSRADAARLHKTDPAHPVITKLADGLFSDTQPVTVALMDINQQTGQKSYVFGAIVGRNSAAPYAVSHQRCTRTPDSGSFSGGA